MVSPRPMPRGQKRGRPIDIATEDDRVRPLLVRRSSRTQVRPSPRSVQASGTRSVMVGNRWAMSTETGDRSPRAEQHDKMIICIVGN